MGADALDDLMGADALDDLNGGRLARMVWRRKQSIGGREVFPRAGVTEAGVTELLFTDISGTGASVSDGILV